MKRRILSMALVALMCMSLLVFMCGCNSDTADTTASTQAETVVPTEDPLWENATYTEDVTLGEGATSIDVEVKAGEKAITITINTDADNLEDALLGAQFVEGEEGAYGLYIKTVNGILADYDVDQSYWAMYKDSEYLTSSAKETAVTSGDSFELVYTK